MLNRLQFIFLM